MRATTISSDARSPATTLPECVLRRDVAAALKQVQADLAASNLSLKVYDCYRPTRAVRRWRNGRSTAANSGAPSGIFRSCRRKTCSRSATSANRSEHSAGTTVDLTMVEKGIRRSRRSTATASYGPCTGPAAQRAPDDSLDMGTGYDCFDVVSHTASPPSRRAAAPAQSAGRRDGEARIPQLPPRMVALHATGTRGPAGSTIFRSSRARIERRAAGISVCAPAFVHPIKSSSCRTATVARHSQRDRFGDADAVDPGRQNAAGIAGALARRIKAAGVAALIATHRGRSGSATTCASRLRSSPRRRA